MQGSRMLLMLASAVSFACGSMAIALLAQIRSITGALTVIVCATYLYGITAFLSAVCGAKLAALNGSGLLVPFSLEMITLWASVYVFHRTNQASFMAAIDHSSQRVLTSFQSLLVLKLLVSGLSIGAQINKQQPPIGDQENLPLEDSTKLVSDPEKFIPMKNSAQTLTPGMEITTNVPTRDANQNLDGRNALNSVTVVTDPNVTRTRYDSSALSGGSVIRHPLVNIANLNNTSETQMTKRRRKRLLRQFKTLHVRFKGRKTVPKALPLQVENDSQTDLHTTNKRGTILSDISGLSKGLIPFVGNNSDKESKHENSSYSLILDLAHNRNEQLSIQNSPQMEVERSAIGRFDNMLLPPYLRINPSAPKTPEVNSDHVNLLDIPHPQEEMLMKTSSNHSNVLDEFDLHTIEGPNDNVFAHDDYPTTEHVNYPSHISLEMWEKNKEDYLNTSRTKSKSLLLPIFTQDSFMDSSNINLKKLETLQESENNSQLVGLGINTSSGFSFPSKDTVESEDKLYMAPISGSNEESIVETPISPNKVSNEFYNNDDAISALDEYLKEEEHQENIDDSIMEESLNQNLSSSFILDSYGNNEVLARHSPTKSVISIMSGNTSLNHKRSYSKIASFLGHSRGNSLVTQTRLPNNSIHSSPTKSERRQRLSQKLSFSNLSDFGSPTKWENKNSNQKYNNSIGHKLNKSIDFSYIHSLQGNDGNSPTKNNIRRHSTIWDQMTQDQRRHSVATDVMYDFPSNQNSKSSFQVHNINTTKFEVNIPNPELREVSGGTIETSLSDETERYPEQAMSEYDKEKWNTLNEPVPNI